MSHGFDKALLSDHTRAMLVALKILEREESKYGMTEQEALTAARYIAKRDRVHMVVGWGMNDDEMTRQWEYAPLVAVMKAWIVLEPIHMIKAKERRR